MIKFEDLENEIQTKLSKIGNITIQKGSWDESSEEFKPSNDLNCYYVKLIKDISKGRIIKSISDFSNSDNIKSEFKKELVVILKYLKNKGCDIYMTHSSTHNQITYDIYVIKTKDIEEWYVPLPGGHWFDEKGSVSWKSPRFWANSNDLNTLNRYCDSKGWVIKKGEDISRELISKSGRGIPAWYDRIYGAKANVGFYFISTGVKEYNNDRNWNIAFVKITDDYFLVFFNPDFTTNRGSSYGECLVHANNRNNVFYKCDQIDGLIKCIDDHQF